MKVIVTFLYGNTKTQRMKYIRQKCYGLYLSICMQTMVVRKITAMKKPKVAQYFDIFFFQKKGRKITASKLLP